MLTEPYRGIFMQSGSRISNNEVANTSPARRGTGPDVFAQQLGRLTQPYHSGVRLALGDAILTHQTQGAGRPSRRTRALRGPHPDALPSVAVEPLGPYGGCVPAPAERLNDCPATRTAALLTTPMRGSGSVS
jgi:hypothetical protein